MIAPPSEIIFLILIVNFAFVFIGFAVLFWLVVRVSRMLKNSAEIIERLNNAVIVEE